MKKRYNVWRSRGTGFIYEMPTDWLPKYGGWDLLCTIEK